MLVLTRKSMETIVVGEATITILHASSGRVSIGIEAPHEVRIVRGELLERDKEAA